MSGIVVLIVLVVVSALYLLLFSLLSAAKKADEIVLFDSGELEFETSSMASDSTDLSEDLKH